jgi:hypothetical protein
VLPDGIFSKTKIAIWVNIGGSCNGGCWYIPWPLCLFYNYFVYFVAIWYIFTFWYVVSRKIWQLCSCTQATAAAERFDI